MQDRVIRGITGIVTDVTTPFKASVQFSMNGREEKAMLKKEKFVYEGRQCLSDEYTFCSILQVGSHVKFVAHGFDPKNPSLWAGDDFGWYIILAWCLEEEEKMTIQYFPGIVNAPTKIDSICTKRQGILSYDIKNGGSHNILFLGSKVYMFGRRLKSKLSLQSQLDLDCQLCCDAVPCDPRQNPSYCSWFATAVWRGKKPRGLDNNIVATVPAQMVPAYKSICSNSRTAFIQGPGLVLRVLNEEFGLALVQLRQTHWSSVLFHRSVCFIRGFCLSSNNLKTIFKKGDKVRMICTSTQNQYPFNYVACQISVQVDGPDEDETPWPSFAKPKQPVRRRPDYWN